MIFYNFEPIQIRKLVLRWHGYRQGVALYFHHWNSPLSEHSELGLTSQMTLAVSLIMRQTHLLGSPFIECSNDPNAASCIKKEPVLYHFWLNKMYLEKFHLRINLVEHSKTGMEGNRTANFGWMRMQLWYSYASWKLWKIPSMQLPWRSPMC